MYLPVTPDWELLSNEYIMFLNFKWMNKLIHICLALYERVHFKVPKIMQQMSLFLLTEGGYS